MIKKGLDFTFQMAIKFGKILSGFFWGGGGGGGGEVLRGDISRPILLRILKVIC